MYLAAPRDGTRDLPALPGTRVGPAPDGVSESPWDTIEGTGRKEWEPIGRDLFFRGALYGLLSNPIYIGEIRHKGVRHSGLHEPIWIAIYGTVRS